MFELFLSSLPPGYENDFGRRTRLLTQGCCADFLMVRRSISGIQFRPPLRESRLVVRYCFVFTRRTSFVSIFCGRSFRVRPALTESRHVHVATLVSFPSHTSVFSKLV